MKSFLTIAGAIFVLLIVTLAVSIGIIATKSKALDRESKEYADSAMRAILTSWNKGELLRRASPELLRAIDRQGELDEQFDQWRHLGNMLMLNEPKGQANLSIILGRGESTTAAYVANAKFEYGSAQIRVGLTERNGVWRVDGFWVYGHLSSISPFVRRWDWRSVDL